MGNRKRLKFSELGRIVTGKTPPTSKQENYGGNIPFVTPTDMDGRRIIDSTLRHLSETGLSTVKNCLVSKGAVLVSCIGSDMGKAAIAGEACVTNQQINSIDVHRDFDSLYVYYDFSRRKAEFRAKASGSAQPLLNKSAFGQLEIELPSLQEQKRIANILGCLDDKIALNHCTSATLEAITRALFKSWFIDFDPVRAKAAGKKTGLPKEIEKLFPSRLVKSELGEVPEGWKAGSFGDICNQVSERAGRQKVEVLSAVASGNLVLSDDHFTKQVYSKETSKYLIVQPGDFAYNPSRINIGSIGIHEGRFIGGVSPVYVVVRPQKGFGCFLECSLTLESTRAHIRNFSSGSVRQSLSYKDFASIPCIIPRPDVLVEFNEQWVDFRCQDSCLKAESKKLEEIRNTLLPMLIHGSWI